MVEKDFIEAEEDLIEAEEDLIEAVEDLIEAVKDFIEAVKDFLEEEEDPVEAEYNAFMEALWDPHYEGDFSEFGFETPAPELELEFGDATDLVQFNLD